MNAGDNGRLNTHARRSAAGPVKALCFTVVVFAIMAGVTLIVDVGHVIFVKMQLQYAASRAVRRGVVGLRDGWQTAQDEAIAAAGKNTANGASVCLLPSNIDFGTYDASSRSFVVLNGAARSSANAMRVTLYQKVPLTFGPLTGKRFCEVYAIAKGTVQSGKPFPSIPVRTPTTPTASLPPISD